MIHEEALECRACGHMTRNNKCEKCGFKRVVELKKDRTSSGKLDGLVSNSDLDTNADVDYTERDEHNDLRLSQLKLIADSDNGPLLRFLEINTIVDIHRIRLMLEMGQEEAKNRVAKITGC